MRYLGAHVSASGGLANCIHNGNELGVNAIQTMFSAPMRWATSEVPQDQIEMLVDALDETSVKVFLIHGVYLINLARQDKQKFHMSKLSVMNHLDGVYRLEQVVEAKGKDLDVLGVTFHPGSAIDCEPEDGVKRIAEGLDWILGKVPGGMVLLESSAGAGNVMGDQLEELAQMRSLASDKDRIGYVLDTQHMFVSGYDWVNDLEGVVEQIERILGLENVRCFHLNDSMKPFASHRDRHANLGEGEIGLEAITNIVNHPKLMDIPFILETPGLKTLEGAKAEVAMLHKIAGANL